MPEIEIKGKTIEEAIDKGIRHLGCERKDAEIKILDEGSSGLFGLMGSKPATVLISADPLKCSNLMSSDESKADIKKLCAKAETVLTDILNRMGIGLKSIGSSLEDKTVNLRIFADSGSFVIGKNGQTLDALEYITQILVNDNLHSRIKTNIDCENYRAKQINKLTLLADKAVDYVSRTGKIYRFEPMSAKERKIIHTYLQDNSKIESFSEGEGALRKVGVKPSKKTHTYAD